MDISEKKTRYEYVPRRKDISGHRAMALLILSLGGAEGSDTRPGIFTSGTRWVGPGCVTEQVSALQRGDTSLSMPGIKTRLANNTVSRLVSILTEL